MVYVIAIVVVVFTTRHQKIIAKQKITIGEDLVKALYDFKDAYQLDSNMVTVKELTTDAIFNDLTIDNEQRALTTYLKFNSGCSTVKVIKSTESYVMYSLVSESIAEDRIFVFFFDVDNDGKVCWFKEVEGIEFVNSLY